MHNSDNNSKGTEAAIRDAMNRGEFENLKGKGKPLDLKEYFDAPEDIRMSYSLLKNAGYIPEEVELLNRIADLKAQLKETGNDEKRADLKKQLRDAQLKLDIHMERMNRR